MSSIDPRAEELIAEALNQRNEALNEQERLRGIVGKIAHVVTTGNNPALTEIRGLVNEAMRREVFPSDYKG